MVQFSEVPTFVAGEPGFAAKLNQLGAVVAELTEAFKVLGEAVEAAKAPAPKATARKAATAK